MFETSDCLPLIVILEVLYLCLADTNPLYVWHSLPPTAQHKVGAPCGPENGDVTIAKILGRR